MSLFAEVAIRHDVSRNLVRAQEKLPDLPPIAVLRRCFGIHQNPNLLPVEPFDLVLAPPAFPGSSFIDFDRHTEVFEAAYRWCNSEIDRLIASARGRLKTAAVSASCSTISISDQ